MYCEHASSSLVIAYMGHISKTYCYHTSFLSLKQYNFTVESTGKKCKKIPPSFPPLPWTTNDLSGRPVLCLYSVRIGTLVLMAVSSFFSRTPGLGNQALYVDLSRITLTTTSARPLGKFLDVLLCRISSFQSTRPEPSSGSHSSHWDQPQQERLWQKFRHFYISWSIIIFF